MKNKSGVSPCGDRVVVLPDSVERVTAGGIIIPDEEADRHQMGQVAGVLVAVGPDAWSHQTTITEKLVDGQLKVVERKVTGYSQDFAKIGDRVCFARYNGLPFDGEDGQQYRLLNDEDITATISNVINFNEFKSRTPLNKETGNV